MSSHAWDRESTYRFGNSLDRPAATLAEIRAGLAELARQAEQDQPVGSGLCQEIRLVESWIAQVAASAETWRGMFRAGNPRDVERVEAARKSPRVERRADVGAAIRDV